MAYGDLSNALCHNASGAMFGIREVRSRPLHDFVHYKTLPLPKKNEAYATGESA